MKRTVLLLCIITSLSGCKHESKETIQSVNNVYETILQRKSVRTYEDRAVEKEKIDSLIRAGMAAPSSRDRRPWEFVIVTDREKLNRMSEGLPYAKMLRSTHQAIIVCGDTVKSDNAWFLDCSAAAQNILIAAQSLGLGAVWTAAFPYPDRIQVVREVLSLPEHIIPLNVIPFGYPAGNKQAKDKFNEEQIHWNEW